MKNPVIIGQFKIKVSQVGLKARQDVGFEDDAVIDDALNGLKAQLDPITRKRISFSDCKLVEDDESGLWI